MSTDTTARSYAGVDMHPVDVPDVDLVEAFRAATAETPYTTTDEAAIAAMTEEEIRAVMWQGPVSTVVPCPEWCGLPAGHGYDAMATALGEPVRNHVVDFTPPGQGRFGVDLDCQEVLLDGELLRGPVSITVYEPGRDVTPSEARTMAAALTAAADRLEKLRSQGATS